MGILKDLTGASRSEGKANYTGSHNIAVSQVLAPTDNSVISPLNPGNFSSIRTKAVVQKPQYFTKDDAQALKTEADNLTKGAQYTRKAYKQLGRIEEADTQVHRAHRKYEGVVADNELEKKRADAKQARRLHTQRPQYTRLGRSIEKADNAANRRITELTAQVEAML